MSSPRMAVSVASAATVCSRTLSPRPPSNASFSKSPSISTPSATLFHDGEWVPETVSGVNTQICRSSMNRCGPAFHFWVSR